MSIRRLILLSSSVASALLVLLWLGTTARSQPSVGIEIVSLTPGGSAAGLSGTDGGASVGAGSIMPRNRFAAGGRLVVFESSSASLVCTDVNSSRDIFLRDRQTGVNTIVSRAPGGAQANSSSFEPVVTPDGRYVVFVSAATNLVPGDTNGFRDVFVRDLQSGATERVSVSSAGDEANFHSHAADISADGRFVVFESTATNLVLGDTNGREDVFLHDRASGITERVSVGNAGEEGTGASTTPAISGNGRYVVFESGAHAFVPEDTNFTTDIYLRDRQMGTTTLVSRTPTGSAPNLGSREPSISADGGFVTYSSFATDIVPPSGPAFYRVYVHDFAAGTTILASVAADGASANADAGTPSISSDGRFVAFESWASNLVAGDTNGNWDIFRRDLLLGTTERISTDVSQVSSISGDGSIVYFQSSSRLLPSDPNFSQDVYLHGIPWPASAPGVSFSISSYSIVEAGGSAMISVERTGNTCAAASVDFSTANGTATAGLDYHSASGTLAFASGESTRTFVVPITNDAIDEPDETVNLQLSNAVGIPLGSVTEATLHILDDDEPPANSAPVAEDDAATVNEDESVVVDVLSNDSDPDGNLIHVAAATNGLHGTTAVEGAGIRYTPSPDFNGTDTFSYTIADDAGATDTATVTVTVTPIDEPPGVDIRDTTSVAGATTPIPDGTGTFTSFPIGSTTASGSVGFAGLGAGGQSGIYLQPAGATQLRRIADLATPVPGSAGLFSAFRDLTLAPIIPGDPCQRLAFIGQAADGRQGIYGSSFIPGDPCEELRTVVDFATPVPDGTGAFARFTDISVMADPTDPVREAVFAAEGTAGERGIYSLPLIPPDPVRLRKLVDHTAPIPGGTGTFTAFGDLSIAFPGDPIIPPDPIIPLVFVAEGAAGQQGIYSARVFPGDPVHEIRSIVDRTTLLPDGGGTFTSFSQPALTAIPGDPCQEVAFEGTGTGGARGVFGARFGGSESPCSGVTAIATMTTPIPDGAGRFTDFLTVSASRGHVAFLAAGAGGQKGIYVASTLTKVIDLGDSLDGKALADIRFGRDGFSGNQICFAVTFTDGSEAIYSVTLDFLDGNDPPLAVNDSYGTSEDVTLSVAAPGVLANDLDPEGSALTAVVATLPAHGTLTLNPDGAFSYSPEADYNGSDTFTYRVIDAAGAVSNIAAVSVTIAPVADPPPGMNRIAFESNRDGNLEIYVMNADGSAQTRLTTNPAADSNPAWSPDRSRIAFTSLRDGNAEIYVMNADGTNQRRLTVSNGVDATPDWSPDGTRITFSSTRDGNLEIYVMNADGSGQSRLTTNARVDIHPVWSPDGRRIAFASNRHMLLNQEIYVMNADGSGVTRITNSAGLDDMPAWSPDGTRIAFVSEREGCLDLEIWVMNADGTASVRLTSTARASVSPWWSADGARIVFASNRDGLLNFEIYSMAADGGDVRRLTHAAGLDLAPRW
jgi:Tol biopolymer transport system component